MIAPDPTELFRRVERGLSGRYRPERIVALSPERVLLLARDLRLERPVSLRLLLDPDPDMAEWFVRESQALGQLDHPAVRHIYDVGVLEGAAYRIGNWIDGESLEEAVSRGPRLVPAVLALARDLLGAFEHAQAQGILVRRAVPAGILQTPGGRSVVTDLRFSSHALPAIPPSVRPTGLAFMAPEIRDGARGEPSADCYAAGALLYYALTGREPAAEPEAIVPPSALRPTTPRSVERIILRALAREPRARYLSPAEMLEDLAAEAGTYDAAAVNPSAAMAAAAQEDPQAWEGRLRRALGDDYELLAFLGQGGFGRVYKVRDLHLERLVALKVLHPALTQDPEVVERFMREAQLAGRLNHANIVNIYDIQRRSGLLWYTMEYVTGPSVAQRVEREGPLPVPVVVSMLREGCAALTLAHDAGLVHRDLKPENLLFEQDGSLRITDFGLALALRGAGRFGGATSQSGTPQFASPEQLLGERVDQRTDLYSLAATACFALLGEPPFPGATPQQVLAKQLADALPDLRAARPDVPAPLEAVLRHALRSDPARRFTDARALREAIDVAMEEAERLAERDWARTAARWLGLETP